jgi:hypothetical protein
MTKAKEHIVYEGLTYSYVEVGLDISEDEKKEKYKELTSLLFQWIFSNPDKVKHYTAHLDEELTKLVKIDFGYVPLTDKFATKLTAGVFVPYRLSEEAQKKA